MSEMIIGGCNTPVRTVELSECERDTVVISPERYDPTVDQTFHKLVNRDTEEQLLYGTDEMKQEALRDCAISAVRQLGLPACIGHFANLQDTVTATTIKKMLGDEISHDRQDLNTYRHRLQKLTQVVAIQLNPEDRQELVSELKISQQESTERSKEIGNVVLSLM